jgi:hypothetical protein
MRREIYIRRTALDETVFVTEERNGYLMWRYDAEGERVSVIYYDLREDAIEAAVKLVMEHLAND